MIEQVGLMARANLHWYDMRVHRAFLPAFCEGNRQEFFIQCFFPVRVLQQCFEEILHVGLKLCLLLELADVLAGHRITGCERCRADVPSLFAHSSEAGNQLGPKRPSAPRLRHYMSSIEKSALAQSAQYSCTG